MGKFRLTIELEFNSLLPIKFIYSQFKHFIKEALNKNEVTNFTFKIFELEELEYKKVDIEKI